MSLPIVDGQGDRANSEGAKSSVFAVLIQSFLVSDKDASQMCVPRDMVIDNRLTRSKMLQIVKYVVGSSSCSQAKHVGVILSSLLGRTTYPQMSSSLHKSLIVS